MSDMLCLAPRKTRSNDRMDEGGTIQVRFVTATTVDGESFRPGDIARCERRVAIHLICDGNVEPVFRDLPPIPRILDSGSPIREVFDAYIKESLVRAGISSLASGNIPRTIYVSRYAAPPKWDRIEIIEAPDNKNLAGENWLAACDYESASTKPASSPKQQFDTSWSRFVVETAIYALISRLKSGKIVACGVPETHLTTLHEMNVDPHWWDRDVILVLSQGELLERDPSTFGKKLRRWSQIRLRNGARPNDVPRPTEPLRDQLTKWITDTTHRYSTRFIKAQYYRLAVDEFDLRFTRNLFNDCWGHANIPPECRAPGRRPGRIKGT